MLFFHINSNFFQIIPKLFIKSVKIQFFLIEIFNKSFFLLLLYQFIGRKIKKR